MVRLLGKTSPGPGIGADRGYFGENYKYRSQRKAHDGTEEPVGICLPQISPEPFLQCGDRCARRAYGGGRAFKGGILDRLGIAELRAAAQGARDLPGRLRPEA